MKKIIKYYSGHKETTKQIEIHWLQDSISKDYGSLQIINLSVQVMWGNKRPRREKTAMRENEGQGKEKGEAGQERGGERSHLSRIKT